MESYKICTLVPAHSENDESTNADWPDDILHLGIVKSKVWPIGHVLKIKLIGGSDTVREKVMDYAQEWTKHANIKMAFVEDATEAEVRVTFRKGGSWSMVGRDCLTCKTGPTMNFGWFDDWTPDEELARTVYHEFGHALGCVHEHQNPVQGIRWDEDKVYDFYAQDMGWNADIVDRNILMKYSRDATQFSRFDRNSIMLYHFPRELTLNGQFVNPNNVLSNTDKDFIGRMYPRRRRREAEWPSSAASPRQPRRSQRIAQYKVGKPATQGVKGRKRKPRRQVAAT
ncbi:hypothetical protein F4808DRAFT_315114 [Astrocystis sublimbata]|nr:hypothetical protein F4808DRAFT_315114 [Astrocystis sublimbata]